MIILLLLNPFRIKADNKTNIDPKVMDKFELSMNAYNCTVQGILQNKDTINFGGYELILIKLYDNNNKILDTIQIKGLLGLKLKEAEVIVISDVKLLIKYQYTDSLSTPRNWFKVVEIYQVKNNKLNNIWKYNLEESFRDYGFRAFIDFENVDEESGREIIILKKKYKNIDRNYKQENKYSKEIYKLVDGKIIKIDEKKVDIK